MNYYYDLGSTPFIEMSMAGAAPREIIDVDYVDITDQQEEPQKQIANSADSKSVVSEESTNKQPNSNDHINLTPSEVC